MNIKHFGSIVLSPWFRTFQ